MGESPRNVCPCRLFDIFSHSHALRNKTCLHWVQADFRLGGCIFSFILPELWHPPFGVSHKMAAWGGSQMQAYPCASASAVNHGTLEDYRRMCADTFANAHLSYDNYQGFQHQTLTKGGGGRGVSMTPKKHA